MSPRLAALLACVAIALSFDLDGYPLLEPDEGRNAEVAREMADRNSYVLPRLNGLPYVDKPVLFFAVTAAAMELLGPTELAARIPPLLFTFATLALVGWWAGRQWGREAGWIAATVTGASPLTLGFARTVIFDSALTFFVTGATICFHEAADRSNVSRSWQRWSAFAWICLALGVLTKGPIALGLPLMVAVPFMAWRRAWRPLTDVVGILLFIVIVMPWVQAVSSAVPGFLGYVLGTETAARLFTPALGRTGPWWYFVPILLAGVLPWSGVLLGSWRSLRIGGSSDRRIVFLILWILVPLLFFSLSQSKRPQYLLPLVPAVALLVAWLWSQRASIDPSISRSALPGLTAGAGTVALCGILLLVVHRALPSVFRGMTPGVAATIPGTALWLGAACLAGAAIGWFGRGRVDTALAGLALPVLAIPFLSGALMDAIGRDRSSAELAEAIRSGNALPAEVVAAGSFPLSLPFYLRQTLTLSSDDARELTSNYLARTSERWRRDGTGLRPASWWREAALTCETPRVFVVRRDDGPARDFLEGRMPLLGESRKHAAYGPCGRTDLARGG